MADKHGHDFTVGNLDDTTIENAFDTVTFAGENGITAKVSKGEVRVGIDQTNGLTIGNSTLNNSGLTVKTLKRPNKSKSVLMALNLLM